MFFSKDNTAKVASLFTDLIERLDVIIDRESAEYDRLNALLKQTEAEHLAAINLRAKIADLVS